MKSKRLNPFQVLRDQLAIMSFYERFEQVVALVLSAVIAVIIMVSLFQLISIVFTLLVLDAFNPLDHKGRCEQVPDMRSSYSSGAHPRGTS